MSAAAPASAAPPVRSARGAALVPATSTRLLGRLPVLLLALLTAAAVLVLPPAPAEAADARDWEAGNIMSDSVFFDPGTMTVAQVQAFLDDRGRNCVAGEMPCLKDVRVEASSMAADGLCRAYTGGTNRSAAQVIVGAASACDVNPRVLLVLLEKEQSLVSRTRPTARSYEAATGFACPDTRPCDPQYAGLFRQLYYAARQYQNYAKNPTSFPRYRPQRTVDVLFHPNAACGSSPVFIQNQATAGLYTYTPYQPNAAALANLYGTGDSCSAYGNRNFWRLYTDWFGSPQAGSFLVRSAASPQVYLIVGDVKHPVNTAALMTAYAPLGPVGVVSSLYLERRRTGAALGRYVAGPDGQVHLVDGGRRYTFATCELAAQFGAPCGGASVIRLTDVQLAAIPVANVSMRATVQTADGRLFHVAGGARREAADAVSLTAAGLPTQHVALSANALDHLPYGEPVVRPGIVLRSRADGRLVLSHQGGLNQLPAGLRTGTPWRTITVRDLDGGSMGLLPTRGALAPFVRAGAGGDVWFLRGTEATVVREAAAVPETVRTLGPDVLDVFTPVPQPDGRLVVRPDGDPLRYVVEAGALRAVRDDAELRAVAGGLMPVALPLSADVASAMPRGRDAALTRFDDVRWTSPFAADIEWLADSGITTGYVDGTYRPRESVSRQAMAAFLYRQAGSPAFTPPSTPTFTDVGPGHPFHVEIEWLASTGITTGTVQPDGTVRYLGSHRVSRQAMAAFLHRSQGSPEVTTPGRSFTDVGPGHPFYLAIEWMAQSGVSTGTAQPDGTAVYLPSNAVSRQAMAAFLHRVDGL